MKKKKIGKFERIKKEFEETNDTEKIIRILELRKFSRKFLLRNISKFTECREPDMRARMMALLTTQNMTDSILNKLSPYFDRIDWYLVFTGCNYSEEFFFASLGRFHSERPYRLQVCQKNVWFHDKDKRSNRLKLFLMLS